MITCRSYDKLSSLDIRERESHEINLGIIFIYVFEFRSISISYILSSYRNKYFKWLELLSLNQELCCSILKHASLLIAVWVCNSIILLLWWRKTFWGKLVESLYLHALWLSRKGFGQNHSVRKTMSKYLDNFSFN